MAIGRRKPEQQKMWITQPQLPKGQGHPFCSRLNNLLAKDGFDSWSEKLCTPSFASKGSPSMPPGVYFRMLFIGYLEGFTSDRASAWNCQDRLSLHAFLGIPLNESTPDHSSLIVWRHRLPMQVYRAAFQRILAINHQQGLISAYAAGVASTTIEANASLKRLARKVSGASYLDYVKELMRDDGVEPADTAAVARFDRKRKDKKLSNQHWQSTTDPDSRITKMKDSTTHLAYKSEHAIDLASGAMLAAEIHAVDCSDTSSIEATLDAANENLVSLGDKSREILCAEADKGYHKAELIKRLNHDQGITTYIPERNTSRRRRWQGNTEACREFHANRRRARGQRGEVFEPPQVLAGGAKLRLPQMQRQHGSHDASRHGQCCQALPDACRWLQSWFGDASFVPVRRTQRDGRPACPSVLPCREPYIALHSPVSSHG